MKNPIFDHIAIIFNPISTGNAKAMAKNLARQVDLHVDEIGMKPTLTPTKYAGHAEKLSSDITKKYKRPLIISVSGDGGYHEVVNGAVSAQQQLKSARPTVAVVGAGNANDHRRVLRDLPLIKLITEGKPRPLDLIHIETSGNKQKLSRYAHSYIGIGISPEVAVELNRHSLSLWREVFIIVRTFLRFRPFRITHDGASRSVDSIVFANINEMAKVLKLNDKLDVTDDRFEVVEFKHQNKLSLLYHLCKSAVIGVKDAPHFKEYTCKVTEADHIQLDGEVQSISPRGTTLTVTSIPQAIDALY
jgi:diacylglycerol kinase family enzyme